MKRQLILLVLVCSIVNLSAQESEVQTLFRSDQGNGWYGAFSMAYSKIDGQDAFVSGGSLAFIFGQKLGLGFGGYGFVNNLATDYSMNSESGNNYTLAGGYGGLILEPIVSGMNAIHFAFPVLIGMGGVAQVDNNYFFPDYGNYHHNEIGSDVFFVIEPAIAVEFNFTRWFRTDVYASYRFTTDVELTQTDRKVLNGLNFGLNFKFGKLH